LKLKWSGFSHLLKRPEMKRRFTINDGYEFITFLERKRDENEDRAEWIE